MPAWSARILFLGFLLWGFVWPPAVHPEGTGDYAIHLGVFDVLDIADSFEGGFEYRLPAQTVSMDKIVLGSLTPALGFTRTTADSNYFFGGLRLPLYVSTTSVFTPHFSAGLFQSGRGKFLGGTMEFRSGVEAAFTSDGNSYLGISFYHLSNGNLYDDNPGSESIVLVYSFDSLTGGPGD